MNLFKLISLLVVAFSLTGCLKQYELRAVGTFDHVDERMRDVYQGEDIIIDLEYGDKRLMDKACAEHRGVKKYSPSWVKVVECKERNVWKEWQQ